VGASLGFMDWRVLASTQKAFRCVLAIHAALAWNSAGWAYVGRGWFCGVVRAGGGIPECCAVSVVMQVRRDVNGFVQAGADKVAVAEVANSVGNEFGLRHGVQLWGWAGWSR
jgi:hypothetical protein